MGEFLKGQFDKLLLSSLIVLAGFFVLHLIHHGTDRELVNQGMTLLASLLGSLITLITGRLFQRRNGGNGNGNGSSAPNP